MLRGTSLRLREIFSFKTTCSRGMLTCKRMKLVIPKKLHRNLPQKMNNTMPISARSKKRLRNLHGSNTNKTTR